MAISLFPARPVKRTHLIPIITAAWILLLVVGSLQPARPGPTVGLHRELHYLAFAATALLLFLLARNLRQEIQAVVAACLLGLSLEFIQHVLYHSPMEWYDVRDDALAILAAFALYRFALHRVALQRL